METDNNLEKAEDKLVQGLMKIREGLVSQSNALQVSIRKDIVAADLKNLLADNTDFYSLKSNLEIYIESLLARNSEEEKNEGEQRSI